MHPDLVTDSIEQSPAELFKAAMGLYKVVGRKQLIQLGKIFSMEPSQVQAVHLGMLLNEEDLPMLSVQDDWLIEV